MKVWTFIAEFLAFGSLIAVLFGYLILFDGVQ